MVQRATGGFRPRGAGSGRGAVAAWALVVLLVAALQTGLPIASDEAYFVAWGRVLRGGFYDHPPLPGWISWLLWRAGAGLGLGPGILHRGFALALGLLSVALLARHWTRLQGRDGGRAVVALVLAPGVPVLFSLFVNDTILTVATLLFLLALERAYARGGAGWHIAAGLALGAMALTKYTGALIWLGALVAFLTWPEGRRFLWRGFVPISLIAALPFLQHLWWNAWNCGATLGFNFAFRTARATGWGPLWLAATLLLATGPVGVAALVRALRGRAPLGLFSRIFLASLAVALAVALWRREFGINWGAPLVPLAFLALAEQSPSPDPARLRSLAAALAVVVLGPVLGLLLALRWGLVAPEAVLPPDRARAAALVMDLADGALTPDLRRLVAGRVMAAPEYGLGAMLEIAGFAPVAVISRSVYGRNQDLFTDFDALAGADMALLLGTAAPERFAPLFARFRVESIRGPHGEQRVLLGDGFRPEIYRRDWLGPVLQGFYARSPVPWLACPPAGTDGARSP